jgi:hypothetical protein
VVGEGRLYSPLNAEAPPSLALGGLEALEEMEVGKRGVGGGSEAGCVVGRNGDDLVDGPGAFDLWGFDEAEIWREEWSEGAWCRW